MKAQAYILQLFELLLTGVLVGSLAFILPGQVTKITPDIEAKDLDDRARILGNVLLGNLNLIYSEDDVSYRGIFDKGKLDSFTEEKAHSYPDSVAIFSVTDTENGKTWSTILPPKETTSEFLEKITCLRSTNYQNLFEKSSNILESCKFNKQSATNEFPISIRYSSDNVYTGQLKILVVE